MAVVILVVSLVLAAIICSVINRNTVGTTGAYVRRFFIVFIVVAFVLTLLFSEYLGLSL